MAFWPLLLAGTIGSVIGNYCWYLAGRRLGYLRLKPLIDRWGRWLTIDWEDMERLDRFFAAHGGKTVLLFRVIPQIGRASGREHVCQYVLVSVVAVTLKKK